MRWMQNRARSRGESIGTLDDARRGAHPAARPSPAPASARPAAPPRSLPARPLEPGTWPPGSRLRTPSRRPRRGPESPTRAADAGRRRPGLADPGDPSCPCACHAGRDPGRPALVRTGRRKRPRPARTPRGTQAATAAAATGSSDPERPRPGGTGNPGCVSDTLSCASRMGAGGVWTGRWTDPQFTGRT